MWNWVVPVVVVVVVEVPVDLKVGGCWAGNEMSWRCHGQNYAELVSNLQSERPLFPQPSLSFSLSPFAIFVQRICLLVVWAFWNQALESSKEELLGGSFTGQRVGSGTRI